MQESQPVVLSELDQKQKTITADIEALQKKQQVCPQSLIMTHYCFADVLSPVIPAQSTYKSKAKTHKHISKISFPASIANSSFNNKHDYPNNLSCTIAQATPCNLRHTEKLNLRHLMRNRRAREAGRNCEVRSDSWDGIRIYEYKYSRPTGTAWKCDNKERQ